MSSSLIAVPFRPVLNLSGTFESGAKLTVYKADSTTLEPIFADSGFSTPLSNPLTADGFGVFPAVYYDSEQPVRVLIEQSSGAGLFDINPYISSPFEAEEILNEAANQVVLAAAEAVRAKASADAAAAVEATVEALVGPTYASTAAGIAATTSGEFFAVVVGDVVSIYLNNAGISVLQRSILSATAVQAALDGKASTSHTHIISNVTGLQAALDAKAPLASPALTGTATVGGVEIGFRDIPIRSTTGTSVVGDRGGCIPITSNFTIPASVFSGGAAISIYNDGATPLTISQGSNLTLRLAATSTTGNRTIAGRGMATIWFRSGTEAIISGPGVT